MVLSGLTLQGKSSKAEILKLLGHSEELTYLPTFSSQ